MLSCTLLRSAKRDRQSSSERARSASERELDLCPLLEIESSDVILARTFQGAKSSQGVNNYLSGVFFFCAHTEEKITPTKPFFMFFQFKKIFPYNVVGLQRTLPNEEGYFQDRLNYLKSKHVKIRSFYLCRRDFRVETDNLTLSHVTVVYCSLLCNRCECGQRFILFY